MNLLISAVHVSYTFESGAPQKLLHNAVPQFSILHFYSEPHELIVIHASSTNESGAPQIDCIAFFASPPFSTFLRSPLN